MSEIVAYRGDQPFAFVCYAHADGARVSAELGWLQSAGIRFWYDEGIRAGDNWRNTIGRSLLDATHVIFFVSKASLASEHCNREINLALDEGKTIVPVYLEDVELTPDLKVGLSRIQALRAADGESYQSALINVLGQGSARQSPPKTASSRNTIVAGVVVVLLARFAHRALRLDAKPGAAIAPSGGGDCRAAARQLFWGCVAGLSG